MNFSRDQSQEAPIFRTWDFMFEEFFKVKVAAVNTVLVPGPRYRTRVGERKGAPWKKAIVTLKEGEKIEFFKGV